MAWSFSPCAFFALKVKVAVLVTTGLGGVTGSEELELELEEEDSELLEEEEQDSELPWLLELVPALELGSEEGLVPAEEEAPLSAELKLLAAPPEEEEAVPELSAVPELVSPAAEEAAVPLSLEAEPPSAPLVSEAIEESTLPLFKEDTAGCSPPQLPRANAARLNTRRRILGFIEDFLNRLDYNTSKREEVNTENGQKYEFPFFVNQKALRRGQFLFGGKEGFVA